MSDFYEDPKAVKAKPEGPPVAEMEYFANAGSYGKGWNNFAYRHRKHSLTQVLHPRYFSTCIDFNLSRGDRIGVFLGEPEDGLEFVLRVVSVDRFKKIVRVSRANSQGKFSFITHPEFDKGEEAAA